MFRSQSISIRFLITAGVALLLFSCVTVLAQDNGLRKTFEAIYAKRDQALKARDATSYNALLAEDFTSKEGDGKIKTRAQFVAETNALLAAIEEVFSCETKVKSVKEGNNQDEVIVEFSDAMKATVKLPDSSLHVFAGKGRIRDTWVRTDAGWRLKYHEVLETSGSVDGKPAQANAETGNALAARL